MLVLTDFGASYGLPDFQVFKGLGVLGALGLGAFVRWTFGSFMNPEPQSLNPKNPHPKPTERRFRV